MGGFCPVQAERCAKEPHQNVDNILFSSFFLKVVNFVRTCPPTSQTVKLIFLYSTVSTLNPSEKKIVDALCVRRHSRRIGKSMIVSISLTDSWNCCHNFSEL